MSKMVTYQWVMIRKLEIPNDCPTEDYYEMLEWLEEKNIKENDILIKETSRDTEIVNVEKIN